MSRLLLRLFIFLLGTTLSFAQNTPTPLALGLRSHYGFIIPHNEAIADISNTNPWAIELEAAWHLKGEKSWRNFGTYPRVGAAINYFNFGNPEIVGNALNLAAFFEPYLMVRNRFNLSFRMGAGLTYMNKPFDPISNPENQFYSTHISFTLMANLMLNYRLSPEWGIRLGGFYNHISNGGLKKPNKGINFPTLSLGAEYILNPFDFKSQAKEDWRSLYPKRWRGKLVLFGTAQLLNDAESKRYPVFGLSAYNSYVIGRVNALTAGVEWVTDYALKERFQREGADKSHHKGSLFVGHEFLLGRFIFSQQFAFYLFRDDFGHQGTYQRYGLEYFFLDNYFLGVNLKSHADVADFLDFRVGVQF